MGETEQPPTASDQFEHVERLQLDLRNPRAPDEQFSTQDEVLEYLLNFVDLNELIQSILGSGWLDYEPLIVLGAENVVLEGNRRLAALRILREPELRRRLKIRLDEEPGANALPSTVRIRRVGSRSEARDYIGFKHINGALRWDALAKAKFAAEWFHEGHDIRQISRRLGDGHNTVVRLVNGWSVLNQSLAQGFDLKETTSRGFPFSHLYTGLARPNVRRYLGLPHENISDVLQRDPVPQERLDHLQQFMSWLYGQGNDTAAIRQYADLNRLDEVLGNSVARSMLESTRDLEAACDQVVDKDVRFSQSLMTSIRNAEDTLRLVPYYDGDRADLMSVGDDLRRTVSTLHAAMRSAYDQSEAGYDSAAGDDSLLAPFDGAASASGGA